MFISFINFYWYFIQDFSKITIFFSSILKIFGLPNTVLKSFGTNDNEIIQIDGKANKTFKNLYKSKKSKKKKSGNLTYIKIT